MEPESLAPFVENIRDPLLRISRPASPPMLRTKCVSYKSPLGPTKILVGMSTTTPRTRRCPPKKEGETPTLYGVAKKEIAKVAW